MKPDGLGLAGLVLGYLGVAVLAAAIAALALLANSSDENVEGSESDGGASSESAEAFGDPPVSTESEFFPDPVEPGLATEARSAGRLSIGDTTDSVTGHRVTIIGVETESAPRREQSQSEDKTYVYVMLRVENTSSDEIIPGWNVQLELIGGDGLLYDEDECAGPNPSPAYERDNVPPGGSVEYISCLEVSVAALTDGVLVIRHEPFSVGDSRAFFSL